MGTNPNEYWMPGIRAGIWLVRAPGSTMTSSFRRVKQSCRVLMLFSFIWLCTAFTMAGTCVCSIHTGPSSWSIQSGSWLTLTAGLVCLRRAMYAWKMSDFTFSSRSDKFKISLKLTWKISQTTFCLSLNYLTISHSTFLINILSLISIYEIMFFNQC